MEITGIIDDWGCPIFECYIANSAKTKSVIVKGIIDTGSFDCHLKKNAIEMLELTPNGEREINHPKGGFKIAKSYPAFCQLGSTDGYGIFEIKAYEMLENYNYDFIMGSVFLLGKNFHYNWQDKNWRIFW
jgi:hypothetical protein